MGIDQPDLIVLAKSTATAHHLFPDVICGICEKESTWNPWAIRWEPAFYVRYVEPEFNNGKISITEARARAFSWGLGQVMGQTARELGYTDYLPQLCDPQTGIEWACRVFSEKLGHAEGNYAVGLRLYNGGRDATYAPSVLELAKKYQ